MAAGAQLLAFQSNIDTSVENLGSVRALLQSVHDFINNTSDLVGFVDATGDVANQVYELSEYAVSIVNLLEKMGPLGQTAKIIRSVLDGGPLDRDPNVLDVSDAIRKVVWKINGDQDLNGNGRIDGTNINPDGEEGMRLENLETTLNNAKAVVMQMIEAIDTRFDYTGGASPPEGTRIEYLESVSQTTSSFITALNVATQNGADWAADFTDLRDSLDSFVTPANIAMSAVNDAYSTVTGSLGDLLDVFDLAKIDLSIDVNLDFGSLEDIMNILEEPLRIAASAIEPIEAYLDAVGTAVDLIVTPVVKFLTETLDLNAFLDDITDQIEAYLPDFSPLDDFEAQVETLLSELSDFTVSTTAEVDALVANIDSAIEKVGRVASSVPVWGSIALGPVGMGSSKNEILAGKLGDHDEMFDAKGGNDTINAGGGNDIIVASGGIDTIDGGSGEDMLYIDASFSEFELFRDPDSDAIKIVHVRPGQNGIDFGSEEITNVEILAFNNVVFDNIQDAIIGGSTLLGDVNADKDDLLILNTSGTTVGGYHVANGLTGDDAIYGTVEADHLIGGAGNDLLIGQDGEDLLDGGSGSDTFLTLANNTSVIEQIFIQLDDGDGTTEDLTGNASAEGNDILLSIENIINEDDSRRYVFGGSRDNTIKSGSKKDILSGGAGDDFIEGGEGGDLLIGGEGSDQLFGGVGFDLLISGGAAVAGESDHYDGGEGDSDRLSYSFGNNLNEIGIDRFYTDGIRTDITDKIPDGIVTNSAVRIDAATGIIEHLALNGSVIATDTSVNIETYSGSNFDDTLYGAFGIEIRGGGGNDTLYVRDSNGVNGGSGDDLIILGPESRYGGLDGGIGNDTLDLSAVGNVRVEITSNISPSTDTSLRLFSIDSELGSIADYNATLNGIENITLSRFDDLVSITGAYAQGFPTNVNTGGGNDTVIHDRNTPGVFYETGAGSDRIEVGFSGIVEVSAGSGNDYIQFYNTQTANAIDAGTGNDTVWLERYRGETVAGGAGFDTLVLQTQEDRPNYRSGDAIVVDLMAGTAASTLGGTLGNIIADFTSFERVIGTIEADLMSGSGDGDQFLGREESDTIDGRGGNDIIYGGDGNDDLSGGEGEDFIHGGRDNDAIDGGTNSDPDAVESDTVSYATAYRNTLLGDLVADTFGGVTVDLAVGTATGAFGNDTLANIENIHGSNNHDTLYGDAGANYLAGGLGNDIMAGAKGDDFFSLEGNDWAEGGNGDDIFFVAGGGNFSIHGGEGSDTLDFSAQEGALTIDLSQSQVSGTMIVMVPVWAYDLGDGINGERENLTPLDVMEADPLYANDVTDTSRVIPEGQEFEIRLVAQSQAFQSTVTGIEEVIGSSGADTIIGRDGNGVFGGASIDLLALNAGSETGQYAQVSGFANMPTNSLTFEMLYRSDRPLDPDGPDLIFASYATSSSSNSILIYSLPDSTIGIRFNSSEYYQTDIATSDLTDGILHRLSIVYDTDQNEIGLFIDGNEVFVGTGTTLAGVPNGGTLIFGQEQDSQGGSFNSNQILQGEVADLRIWNDVRTDQEIADNAFVEIADPVGEQGLVANWRPNSSNETAIVDATGGPFLTLNNADSAGPLPAFSRLDGGNANDKLAGGNGNDNLIGGLGADTHDGGNGNDRAQYTDATAGVLADLQLSNLNTGFAAGDTYISIERLYGSRFEDNLRGDAAANVLWGHNGDDRLYGRGGNDNLQGMNGNDVLHGQDGNDSLTGGAEGDTFVFQNGFGQDIITDFDVSQSGERIVLRDVTSITNFSDLHSNHLSQSATDTIINDGQGNTITLLRVNMGDLAADDFLF
jgi:Ca2+-binding RTX toxin-like protein